MSKGKAKPNLHAVPPPGEEWIAARFSLPAYVTDRDPPYRPEALVWMSQQGVLYAGIFHPDEPNTLAVDKTLNAAMRSPMVGPPRRPARIRVADEALVPPIRAVVGESVAIHVRPVPEMEPVRNMLSRLPPPTEADEADAWIYDPAIHKALVAGFHSAAARLYQCAPWTAVPDDAHVFAVSIPALDIDNACLSVIGQMGESLGMLLYRSLADYISFRRMAIRGQGSRHKPRSMGAEVFSVNFEAGSQVPPKARQSFMREGWELASKDAYPHILRIDADMVGRPLAESDVVLAWALCDAMTGFVNQHRNALHMGFPGSISERFAIQDIGKALARPQGQTGQAVPLEAKIRSLGVAVVLTAPHPEASQQPLLEIADWGSGTTKPGAAPLDEIADFDADDEFDDEDDDEDQEEINEVVDPFLDAALDQGKDEDWIGAADYICELLCRYKLDEGDDDLTEWEPDLIEQFMMEQVPRHVMAEQDVFDLVPDILGSFVQWLGQQRHMPKRQAESLRKRLLQLGPSFVARTLDPRNYGPGKLLFQQMKQAGVDLEDEDAVQRYMDDFNRRGGPK